MPSQPSKNAAPEPVAEWTLPGAATLGSSVRAKGILLEIRSRLPFAARKSLEIRGAVLVLHMPEPSPFDGGAVAAIVSSALMGIETLPIIPREIEDILTISTTERHRWLKDGRLQSAGTRTVKLRGRARKITFHVFDPRHVEDLLDRDQVAAWREDDKAQAAENRRRAAGKAALKRVQKTAGDAEPDAGGGEEEVSRPTLTGWDAFARDLLWR